MSNIEETQIESEYKDIQAKVKSNPSDFVATLKLITASNARQSKSEETKLKYVVLFNDYLKNNQNDQNTEKILQLDLEDQVDIYDFINKIFAYIADGTGDFKSQSQNLLKLAQKMNEKNGNALLVRYMSRKKCLLEKAKA